MSREDPTRWLISYSQFAYHHGTKQEGSIKTRIIETEPSIWWRAREWKTEFESGGCVILMVHRIPVGPPSKEK